MGLKPSLQSPRTQFDFCSYGRDVQAISKFRFHQTDGPGQFPVTIGKTCRRDGVLRIGSRLVLIVIEGARDGNAESKPVFTDDHVKHEIQGR